MKGTYILVIFLNENSKIKIGSLGKVSFPTGFYLYIGSAMGTSGSVTLINRVKRHLLDSKYKKLHWHIDYLLDDPNSKITKIYFIPSSQSYECRIAEEILLRSDNYIENFGSSDCQCKSHLLYFKKFINFNP
jgi:Uri superfamily endonuclease